MMLKGVATPILIPVLPRWNVVLGYVSGRPSPLYAGSACVYAEVVCCPFVAWIGLELYVLDLPMWIVDCTWLFGLGCKLGS